MYINFSIIFFHHYNSIKVINTAADVGNTVKLVVCCQVINASADGNTVRLVDCFQKPNVWVHFFQIKEHDINEIFRIALMSERDDAYQIAEKLEKIPFKHTMSDDFVEFEFSWFLEAPQKIRAAVDRRDLIKAVEHVQPTTPTTKRKM